MFQKVSLSANNNICSVFQLYLSMWYLANHWITWWTWGSFPWALTSCLLKLLRQGAARQTATWSQMNAPCKQLRSMKGPQCAWSIRQDLGQVLRMLEAFPCSCYSTVLARGRSSSQLVDVYLSLWQTFVDRELTSNRCEDVIDMCVKCFKKLYFWQMTVFVVFFSLILARDTWPIIE